MDVGLRASLAQIAGEETSGGAPRPRGRAVRDDQPVEERARRGRARARAPPTPSVSSTESRTTSLGDVSGNAAAAPLDALRYLVVEAAAFGAGLHAAEKLGERYDLLHVFAPRRVRGVKFFFEAANVRERLECLERARLSRFGGAVT